MTIRTMLLAGVAAAVLPAAASADTVLRFGHVGAPGSLFEASADAFAECVNANVDGVEVQTFGSSQLGKDQEMLQKLKLNQIAFSLPSSVMSSVAPEFGIFEMPYIIKDRDHMKRVQSEMGDTFEAAAEREGYKIVGYFENGFRHITNNTRPINQPEDLAGIKLRTPNGEWRVKMFQLYGANPTPMAFSDVFNALQTNAIDGQENPYAQIASAKFQEVQDYLSVTGHVYTPAYVTTSINQWNSWPAEVQQGLSDCAASSQDFVYSHAAQLEVDLLDEIKAAGVTVNEADKDAFITASQPIYDEFASTVDGGAEMIEQIKGLSSGS